LQPKKKADSSITPYVEAISQDYTWSLCSLPPLLKQSVYLLTADDDVLKVQSFDILEYKGTVGLLDVNVAQRDTAQRKATDRKQTRAFELYIEKSS
jgi:hypothetical protein